MVFCTYCGRPFTRMEHLERHILSHTNVKPFKCFMCHMSFTRRNLLQRHYTVHGRDQNNQEGLPLNNGIIPISAGRALIACSNCAKMKTKCDKKFPCSGCAGRNLKCTIRPTRRASKQINRVGVPVQPGENGMTVSGASSKNNGENESHDFPSSSSPPAQSRQLQYFQQQEFQQQQQQQQLQHHYSASHHSHSTSQQSVPQQFRSQHASPGQEKPLTDGPPAMIEQTSHPKNEAFPAVPPHAISLIPTPMNGFVQHTWMSGYEEFTGTNGRGSDDSAIPQFTMDWQQMPMAAGFDLSIMTPDMAMDFSTIH